jgi:hypothetical protein
MSDPNESTSTGDGAPFSPNFLEFCAKVRKDDPSILQKTNQPLRIRPLGEKEDIELASALLENTNVRYLELNTAKYTRSSAEAMAKYVRTSKHLQRIRWHGGYQGLLHSEEINCCLLSAFQESTSLKELDTELPSIGGPSNLALGNMLANTHGLQALTLSFPAGLQGDLAVATASSGLKKNTTIRELTLVVSQDATTICSILISLCDNPLLRSLCLREIVVDLTDSRLCC